MTAQRHSTPITNHLMTIDTCFEYINIHEIKNRRFMLNTRTGILLLGDEKYGKTFLGSHAEEFHSSGATGSYDDYLRGWIVIVASGAESFISPRPSRSQHSIRASMP